MGMRGRLTLMLALALALRFSDGNKNFRNFYLKSCAFPTLTPVWIGPFSRRWP